MRRNNQRKNGPRQPPPQSRRPVLTPAQVEAERRLALYRRTDIDILAISYNVAAIRNRYPLLSPDIVASINQPSVDEVRDVICQFIFAHVKNKRHFDYMIEEANKRRAQEKARGTHWYDRVVPVPTQLQDDSE